MVLAPDGDVAVISGFRREKNSLMWIVEETMERAEGPMEPDTSGVSHRLLEQPHRG
jgi:hypothetical protein